MSAVTQRLLAHSKLVLLSMYPFDPVFTVHSALANQVLATDNLFSAASRITLEFVIDRSPETFVRSDAFRDRFARWFGHSLPDSHGREAKFARRCRSLVLRGTWSSNAVIRVMRVLDAPLESLCIHMEEGLNAASWRTAVEHPKFVEVCASKVHTLVMNASRHHHTICPIVLGHARWEQLRTLVLYECGAFPRLPSEWITSTIDNFPALERIYVFGVYEPPIESDYQKFQAAINVSKVERLGDASWPLTRDGAVDYLVTIGERKHELPGTNADSDSKAPASSSNTATPARGTAAAGTTLYVTEPQTYEKILPIPEEKVTGIRDVLNALEEQRLQEKRTHRLQEQQRLDDADSQNRLLLQRMLNNAKRNIQSRQLPQP